MVTRNPNEPRGKKYRKFGRKDRPARHHQGQVCPVRPHHCRNLLESRKWSKELNCYVSA